MDTISYSPNGATNHDSARTVAVRKFARIISNVGSPPVVALIAVLVSVYAPPKTGLTWVSIAFILIAVLIPIIYVIQLVRSGKVTDFHLPSRHERAGPFLVTLIAGIVGWLLVLWIDSPRALKLVALINVIQTALLMLITTQWKISIHNTAITGLAIISIYLMGRAALPSLLCIPLIGWSRVYLKRHSIEQVIAGTILGTVLVLATIFYYRVPV